MAVPAVLAALGRAGTSAGGAATAASGGQIGRALQQTKAAAGQAAGAVGQVNRAMGSMVHALSAGSNAIKGLAAPMQALVGLRSPIAVQQFSLAMRDTEATIGQVLLPVWNALIGAARSMGDTYATLADSVKPLMSGIATRSPPPPPTSGNSTRHASASRGRPGAGRSGPS